MHYTFQNGNRKVVGSERIDAESGFVEKQIDEGNARQKYNRDGYTFLATQIERR